MTEIWPGSRLSLSGDWVAGAFGTGSPDPFVLAFLLAVALAVLLLYNRLVAAVSGASAFFRSEYATSETLGNNYLCGSIGMMFLLLVPFYAVALRRAALGHGYWQVLAAVCVLFLLRKALLSLMAWLHGDKASLRPVERVGYGVFVLVALASLLPVPLISTFSSNVLIGYRIYLIIIALAGYILYAVRSFPLILSTGFSSFFWVLYLCTLEILPVCVVANYLLNGN